MLCILPPGYTIKMLPQYYMLTEQRVIQAAVVIARYGVYPSAGRIARYLGRSNASLNGIECKARRFALRMLDIPLKRVGWADTDSTRSDWWNT